MNNTEKVRLMSGSREDKQLLFDYLIEKSMSETGLEDADIGILEFLKKDMGKTVVVTMSASLNGNGGVNL